MVFSGTRRADPKDSVGAHLENRQSGERTRTSPPLYPLKRWCQTQSRLMETPRPGPDRSYLLISPCRDEAQFVRRTLDSVVAQSIPPAKWIIVDDGSTDETPEILSEYAAEHDFIEVLRKPSDGERKVGPGVIAAFYHGYERAQPERYEYVCKLDVDLELPRDYFERIMRQMEANPRIGTFSGKPYYPGPSNVRKTFDGELISEGCGNDTSVGAIKFFRRRCFEEIGGFEREVMWDGIDCHRCRMLGWIAESRDEPELRFLHLRPMGSSHKGIITGRKRHGFGQWFMGTSPLYMLASSIFRMSRPPFIVGGAAMGWGYLESALKRKRRLDDPEFRSFLRKYQFDVLVKGKSRAVADLNEKQAARWFRDHGDMIQPAGPGRVSGASGAPVSNA